MGINLFWDGEKTATAGVFDPDSPSSGGRAVAWEMTKLTLLYHITPSLSTTSIFRYIFRSLTRFGLRDPCNPVSFHCPTQNVRSYFLQVVPRSRGASNVK